MHNQLIQFNNVAVANQNTDVSAKVFKGMQPKSFKK